MMINSTPKRKNDDEKAKGHPRNWTLIAVGVIALLGISLVGIFFLTDNNASSNALPTSHLAYTSDGKQYVLNLQTGDRLLLDTRLPVDYRSRLSPDGDWIISWELVTEYYEWSLVLKPNGIPETSETLITCICYGTSLSWARDSHWVAFSALPDTASRDNMPDSQEELWLINVFTKERKRLTNNNFRDSGPAFSPDSTQIAYTSAMDGYNRLYIMDVATGQSRLLTPTMHGYRATWSPDGQWLAFMTTHLDYSGDIWIIRADGTGAQAITTGPTRDDDPVWAP